MSDEISSKAWVLVSTKITKPLWEFYSYSNDSGRSTASKYDDLKPKFKQRWDEGQKVATIGATVDRFYMTFVKGGRRRGGQQSMVCCYNYDQLLESWREKKDQTITQIASRGGEIIALFEPMHSGEKSMLRNIRGKLSASEVKGADNGDKDVTAATYFEKENRWIFVMSSFETSNEKWQVGPVLSKKFIKSNLDDGYLVRVIVAGGGQWFVMMQKTSQTVSIGQTVHYLFSATDKAEEEAWEAHHNLTCATGNAYPAASTAVVPSGSRPVSRVGAGGSGGVLQRQQMAFNIDEDGLSISFSSVTLAMLE